MHSESDELNRQGDISPAMNEAISQANLPADTERFLRNLLTGPSRKHEDVMAEMQQWITEKKEKFRQVIVDDDNQRETRRDN